ncbi:MAG: type secretion system protein [Dehalococcoidia bacterium]|nr:type secretion system protein [Dehalococcoidia bacterium]
MIVLAILPSIGLAAGILLFFMGLTMKPKTEGDVQMRLSAYGTRPPSLEELELQKPLSERVFKPIMASLSGGMASKTPQRTMEQIFKKLDSADNPNNLTVSDFLGLKLFGALAGAGGATLIAIMMGKFAFVPLTLLGGAFMGSKLPDMWLGGKISAKQKGIQKALPDALDLLTIGVGAGLGFEQGISKIAEKWDNALCLEFRRFLREQRMGVSRREAMRTMAERCDVPDLSSFCAAIIQADQLGVSISNILVVQSEDIRTKQRQKVEQTVATAPLKMTFPMILFMLPALWIIILGPIVPMVAKMMK